MNMMSSSCMPGDPRLIDQIVYELKSQGIFDQFRKECIADVDTKPAYQNLSQRVEGRVMNFLNKQKFSQDINKNQLRDQLRKNIAEPGFLDSGVERIVDQVVNPKINTVFLPKVEDVVYRFLGIERPNQENSTPELKPKVEDLLPNDLEAVSPESVNDPSANSTVNKKGESSDVNDTSLNSSNNKTEDESPPFEPLEENTKVSLHEDNSVDSNLSGLSGLASHDSNHSANVKMEMSQDISQNFLNSTGNVSLISTDEDTKMEIYEDTVMSEASAKLESVTKEDEENSESNNEKKMDVDNGVNVVEADIDETVKVTIKLHENKSEIESGSEKIEEKKSESITTDQKRKSESSSDQKRSHDKYKSSKHDKDRKEDKDKRSRSKSESKSSKDKSSSKHSSSEKDKKEYTNGKEDGLVKKEGKGKDKSKDKSSKSKESKEKSDKNKEKPKDKDRSSKDKERSVKEKNDKEKYVDKSKLSKDSKDKEKSDKTKSERDKSSTTKSSKERISSTSSKRDEKPPRDKSSSSKDRSSSSKNSRDKEFSRSSKEKEKSKSSISSCKDKDKKGSGDSKSSSDKSRSEKDKSSHKSSSSAKKDRDKRAIDDHYSLKDKRGDRRSTDRDSNDGSTKTSRNSSFAEASTNSVKGSSKGSSETFSSGGGDSSNSDKLEENIDRADSAEAAPPIKYIKPKFASNIHEAMKIMKIRKQLAKMERQNQLALANVPEAVKNSNAMTDQESVETAVNKELPTLKSQDLSMENFEALEARLAQEMSNVNDHMYGDEDDNYECSSVTIQANMQQVTEKNNVIKNELILCDGIAEKATLDSEHLQDSTRQAKVLFNDMNNTNHEIELIAGNQILSTNKIESLLHQTDAVEQMTIGEQMTTKENEQEVVIKGVVETSEEIKVCPIGNTDEAKINDMEPYEEFKGFLIAECDESKLSLLKKLMNELETKYNKFQISYQEGLKLDNVKLTVDTINLAEPDTHLSSVKEALLKNVTLQDTNVKETITAGLNGSKCFLESLLNDDGDKTVYKVSNNGGLKRTEMGQCQNNGKISNTDEPCYYFESDPTSEIQLNILNTFTLKLEKSIQVQSLKLQNNISTPKKRGRKRKTESTENNNSLECGHKSEKKKRLLSDSNGNANVGNTCNTNLTSNHGFNLPLSPAESDKSGDNKKEEPMMFNRKRTTRDGNKRYSSEDLYKPRPILSCTSSRRRNGRNANSKS